MTTEPVSVGDVIQLDPAKSAWGPLFAVVDSVKGWGVVCYFYVSGSHGEAPGAAPLRVSHGDYIRIGKAAWVSELGREDGGG